jgi:3-methyl-2-oxobutanoate hydroxymethyltransferase
MKEAGCDAVKLEGGEEMCDTVRALTRAGVPVMGHVGLTPQTAGQLGGFKVQGRDLDSARKMVWDAKALADAGVFSIVLECVPGNLAEVVTGSTNVPTIGIGAGPGCDGQVLVTHDLLGMFAKSIPSFVKKYADLAPQINEAVATYCEEVRSGVFPDQEHTFSSNVDLGPLLEEKDK